MEVPLQNMPMPHLPGSARREERQVCGPKSGLQKLSGADQAGCYPDFVIGFEHILNELYTYIYIYVSYMHIYVVLTM